MLYAEWGPLKTFVWCLVLQSTMSGAGVILSEGIIKSSLSHAHAQRYIRVVHSDTHLPPYPSPPGHPPPQTQQWLRFLRRVVQSGPSLTRRDSVCPMYFATTDGHSRAAVAAARPSSPRAETEPSDQLALVSPAQQPSSQHTQLHTRHSRNRTLYSTHWTAKNWKVGLAAFSRTFFTRQYRL